MFIPLRSSVATGTAPAVLPPLAQVLWPVPVVAPSGSLLSRPSVACAARGLVLTFAGSLLTALAARVSIPLPFTPVPLTGQTFAVLLTGALLGPRLGALSLLLYLAEGALGLPVFAGGKAGIASLLGPTGGYLLAFPLAASFVGLLVTRRGWDRRPLTTVLAMLLGSLLIFALGVANLARFVGGLEHAFLVGMLPFLPGDVVKASLAAVLLPGSWRLLRQRAVPPVTRPIKPVES